MKASKTSNKKQKVIDFFVKFFRRKEFKVDNELFLGRHNVLPIFFLFFYIIIFCSFENHSILKTIKKNSPSEHF